MHLNLARHIGRKNGAKTDLDCVFYIVENGEELLGFENIWIELKELFEEAKEAGIEIPGGEESEKRGWKSIYKFCKEVKCGTHKIVKKKRDVMSLLDE